MLAKYVPSTILYILSVIPQLQSIYNEYFLLRRKKLKLREITSKQLAQGPGQSL